MQSCQVISTHPRAKSTNITALFQSSLRGGQGGAICPTKQVSKGQDQVQIMPDVSILYDEGLFLALNFGFEIASSAAIASLGVLLAKTNSAPVFVRALSWLISCTIHMASLQSSIGVLHGT